MSEFTCVQIALAPLWLCLQVSYPRGQDEITAVHLH